MMRNLAFKLLRHLEKEGWYGKFVSISHLQDLQESILGNRERGLYDQEFYEMHLSWFAFRPPEDLPAPKSLIIVAVPVPQVRIIFHRNGECIPLVLPPTYVGYRQTTVRAGERLAEFLGPRGFRVAHTRLPLKLLAVRSGLAEYGRNNLVYRAGMGSFLQLAAFYSDFPSEEDSWQEPQMMKRCESCTACLQKCPTGAISQERFLLRAGRCVTFHNERIPPFPEWLGSSWHNSLIGCMLCQQSCPEDKHMREWIEDGCEFSEEETRRLVDGTPVDRLPAESLAKLRQLNLSEDLNILLRNLSVILELRGGRDQGTAAAECKAAI